MPLFTSSRATSDNTTTSKKHNTRTSSSSPERKRSIFSNHRSTSSSESEGQSNRKTPRSSRTGIFGNRLRNKSRSIDGDPSIVAAREKVSEAEQAEKEAKHALMEARKHVRTLEEEAVEEGRIARLKQAEAKVIHKSVKSLGHGS